MTMAEFFRAIIQIISIITIPAFLGGFLIWGIVKKVRVYEVFVEGAKEGFNVAVRIIPYLVAILVAIGIFRASGAMDVLIAILSPVTNLIGLPAEALPVALMRPLSGSGSLGIMTELMKVHGPDSFIGVLASTFYGSSETTFYVLAVYFGSVNIKNTRHALPAGLIADFFGMLAAVFIVRLLFGV
jgi:spore maturation protein B